MSTCADHTYGPSDYVERAEWGERMVETHVQSACDECHLYLIWTPKDGADNRAPTEGAISPAIGSQTVAKRCPKWDRLHSECEPDFGSPSDRGNSFSAGETPQDNGRGSDRG
jgi:hypothetical protein